MSIMLDQFCSFLALKLRRNSLKDSSLLAIDLIECVKSYPLLASCLDFTKLWSFLISVIVLGLLAMVFCSGLFASAKKRVRLS